MTQRLTLKTRFIIFGVITALTVLLFSIGVFGLLKTPFNWHILLNYLFIGLALAVYTFILLTYRYTFALMLFAAGYIVSFISLFYMFANATGGFSDLAGIILWMITMGLMIALGITIEALRFISHRNKPTKVETADVIDVIETEDNKTE